MMMMMITIHHHRPKVDGHFDGLIASRLKRRACRTIEEVQGFNMSHWTTLSAGYSPHTAPAAAMVIFCVAKNEACAKLLQLHCARSTTSLASAEPRGSCKQGY